MNALGRTCGFGLLLAAISGGGRAAEIEIDEALRLAEAQNPRVMAAREEWKAFQREANIVRSLPNPVIGLAIAPSDARIHTARGPISRRYTVEQKFPFPGKRKLAGREMRERARMAKAHYLAVRLIVRSETAEAFARLYYVDRSIAATEEQEELIRRFVRVAERKYATGRHPQSDVFRAQVEQAKLANGLLTLRGERITAQARLNALLGRGTQDPLGDPVLKRESFEYSLEELENAARTGNPGIAMRRADVERLNSKRKAARLRYFPDLVLGYEYSQLDEMVGIPAADGGDAQSLIFKLELPLWIGPSREANRQVRHQLASARAAEENSVRDTLAEVIALAVEARTHLRLAGLFEGTLIPLAEGTLSSTQKGYEADRAGFLDVLDSHRSLLDIKLEYHQHLSEYWAVRLRLEGLLGGPLKRNAGGEMQ